MIATQATAHNLNDLVEFDSPFVVREGGLVTAAPKMLYAPDVYYIDGELKPSISSPNWSFVDGYSGQFRYSGPVMHPSEFLGGRMAEDVLATPGAYVLCVVEDLDDPDDPAGWVLLRRTKED